MPHLSSECKEQKLVLSAFPPLFKGIAQEQHPTTEANAENER